jgi:LmbE family N-acetylglucosaminyl deacetylase
VVAHPDDEALWFSGLVLSRPDLRWTVICCTIPRRDPQRAWMFFDACQRMGATGRLLPFTETSARCAEVRGLDLIDMAAFDVVVTHNEVGEYGHRHHRVIHQYVRARCAGRMLVSGYGMADGITVVHVNREDKTRVLGAYHYETTYRGHTDAKYRNLIRHYHDDVGFDLWRETYHAC